MTQRWKEINVWLAQHDVDNFVILDDAWDELIPFHSRLVCTTLKDGLTKERAELAIELLNEGE